MPATQTNEGRVDQVTTVVGVKSPNLRVKLYKTAVTNSVGRVLADFTEADFSGYAAITPTAGSPTLDGNGNALVPFGTCTFTHNGGGTGNTIYGYYVVDISTSKVQFFEPLAAPVTLNANGQHVDVTPNWYCGTLPPPL